MRESWDVRTKVLGDAVANIKKAQEKQKVFYEKRHQVKRRFKADDKVKVRHCRKMKGKGGKMDKPWSGPHVTEDVCCNRSSALWKG